MDTQRTSTSQDGQLNTTPLEEQGDQRKQHDEPRASRPVFHCANCDIEFPWPPTAVQGKIFCCTGCAAGGPCNCDYSLYHSVTISGVIHYNQ
jgi:hypothetical protein